MATDYTTTIRIDSDHTAELTAGGRGRTAALVLGYVALWLTFTLGGVLVALTLAELSGGLVGVILLLTVGLGAIAAGPAAAKRVMGAALDRVE